MAQFKKSCSKIRFYFETGGFKNSQKATLWEILDGLFLEEKKVLPKYSTDV